MARPQSAKSSPSFSVSPSLCGLFVCCCHYLPYHQIRMDALANLPSRGNFVSPTPVVVNPKAYVADHDTEPPAGQEIHSDPENILIRTLLMRKDRTLGNKGKQQEKGKAADKGKGKRPAETAAGASEAKRTHCDASGSGEGGGGQSASAVMYLADQLRSKTNQELVDILKSRGLAGRGKKEELVQRILEAQDRSRRSGQR